MWGHMAYYMGGIWMFIWPVILIIVIAYIFRSNSFPGYLNKPETALEILKKRYARGEITQEEYNRLKKELNE